MRPTDLQHAVVLSLFAGRPLFEVSAVDGIDPRAFRADRYRNARLTQAVLERLPAFSSVFLGRPGAWAYALGFGTSAEFRGLVSGGRELGEAGVAYFARCPLVDVGLAGLLELEAALCARPVRRMSSDGGGVRRYMLGRRAQVVHGVPTLGAWYAERMGFLMAGGQGSLWERAVDASRTGGGRAPANSVETRAYLVLRGDGSNGGSVEDLEGAMAELLGFLSTPQTLAEVCAAFVEDLSQEDAAELLDSLVADGVVDCVVGEAW